MAIRGMDADDPIVQLSGRIAARANGNDPRAALDPRLLDDVATLRRLISERGGRRQARRVLSLLADYTAACVHFARHRHLGAADGERDLLAAIELFRPVHEYLPEYVPWSVRSLLGHRAEVVGGTIVERAETLARDGVRLAEAAAAEHDRGKLGHAVAMLREAVDDTPPGHPLRGQRLSSLCAGLVARHELIGDERDAAGAVAAAREAAAATRPDSPFYASTLYRLGAVLRARANATGDQPTADEAIETLERAAAAMPGDHPDRAGCLRELGLLRALRSVTTRDAAAMDRAVGSLREAVAAAGEAGPGRLEQFGFVLVLAHQRTGDRRHITEAVAVFRRAVGLAPDPERPRYQAGLASACRLRFASTREPAAIEEAVAVSRAALSAARSAAQRVSALGELGSALTDRAAVTGDVSDLHAAVDALRQAIAADPGEAPWRSALGSALLALHLATGDDACLDEAIRSARAAVVASPPEDPMRPLRQNLLGRTLWHRGDRTGDREALAEAITTLDAAAEQLPDDHPLQLTVRTNLGAAFGALYRQTREADALHQSVAAFRWVADRMPEDHVKRGSYLGNLGGARYETYLRTGDRAERDAAIGILAEAVRHRNGQDPPAFLSNLAAALMDRHDETGSAADLDLAADAARRAVTLLADDHPTRCVALTSLGRTHLARHRAGRDPAQLDQALELLSAAAAMPTAPAEARILAARQCGDAALGAGKAEAALAALTTAVEQLPLVSGRQLSRPDQELQLARHHGLASDAAASAIAAGRPERAVELLEAGRAILHARVLESRGDLADLRARAPELARRFAELRDDPALAGSAAAAPDAGGPEFADRLDTRHELAREWAELVRTVRTEHGGAGLFRPPRLDELVPAAADGPVVMINVSRYRCDALAVTASGVRAIPLPGLASATLAERAAGFVGALGIACGGAPTAAARDAAEETISATITWLRDTVTQPVLAAFDAPVPRIWWSPTSLLSFLPLHAAVTGETVSSYTPTVGALLRARGRRQAPIRRGLVVALPNTPGLARLPGVTRERDLLTELFPETVVLRGPQATRAGVLRELPAHEWVHLACHGRNDVMRPSSSNVRLWDGPLSVQDLAALDTERGVLAVLTACETAQGGALLADEALHIGAAFHLAGYPHVIATLWSAHDAASAELTEAFYRGLGGSAASGLDATRSATALHAAVRQLRDRYPDRPSRWAPYLHVGP
ncbi:CHAT domain-containing protein [Amycolatopsis australiensis]|uniref:CHAT domain-containing protein n=1 Tax=Amycolatopsis australiensis TaxID=546364 RepID=A0A1K1SMW5_9PSEU|nr:CHAT domain-containing protein [Amycolatopsis australiensis]SFW85752.1 CHAT domain-containing protein [Amycolatopsis australiensis]